MNKKPRRFRITHGSQLGALALDVVDESTRTWVARNGTVLMFIAGCLERAVADRAYSPDPNNKRASVVFGIVETPATVRLRFQEMLEKAYPEERFDVQLELSDRAPRFAG